MVLYVGEKLDFLMNLTNTQNSTLGRVLHFDSSYISRIRNGNRGVPKHQPFIRPAAAYFAENLRENYQRAAVMDRIQSGRSWPESQEEAEELLAGWLSAGDRGDAERMGHMISGLSGLRRQYPALQEDPELRDAQDGPFFYGNSGKRLAVEQMLTELIRLGTPQTLLLCSDEDMTWMYEDGDFLRRWSELMSRLIAAGTVVKVIHTVSRNSEEMFTAIQQWMPLYLSGAIEPFYDPQFRDSTLRRTMFLARGRCALISGSVGNQTGGMLNMMIREPEAVDALELEFQRHLDLCRPLMSIFTVRNREDFRRTMEASQPRQNDLMLAGSLPSLFTMPMELALTLEQRAGVEGIAGRCQLLKEQVMDLLHRGYTVTEILHLPGKAALRSGELLLPLGEMYDMPPIRMTRQELKLHLGEILRLTRQEENYRVLISGRIPKNIFISAAEKAGVAVTRAESPGVVFLIREERMAAAMWEYLSQIGSGRSAGRQSLKKLEDYIDGL